VSAYGFGFAKNHCFTDGNKRIRLVAIDVFLQLNGYELIAEEAEAAIVIEGLAAGEMSEDELANWIEHNATMPVP
jgi:death-on-curing protein